MASKRLKGLYAKEAKEFLSHVMQDKPLLPFLVPLGLFAWAIERWLVPLSNWVPLAFAVWATIQYGRFQRQILVENLNGRWKQLILNTSPITPFEPCEWLNKLLMEVWPNYLEPKLSRRFSSIVERRMKNRKPRLIEKLELQEFSLGSCPPNLGRNGMHWITSGEQKVLRLGFDWDTNEMSVMLLAKLAMPLIGTARIVINQIHIKGDLLLTPILDGQAILYSFESTPEVRIGVAFGSGGSQTLQATELPGVSTWLLKYVADDSTTFWAIGHQAGVLAKQAEYCGKVVEMVVPFEETNYGELAVRLVLKEWQFSDGSFSSRSSIGSHSQPSVYGSASNQSKTGRKLRVTVVEGRNLAARDKSGRCDPYVKLQYGKAVHKTKTISHTTNPVWNQMFDLEEIGGGEHLKIKCYSADKFSDENIGSAHVNMEGIEEGTSRDVWVPLEKVNSGEVRLQVEAVNSNDYEGQKNSPLRPGIVELVLIEARDLIAADLRGTSDPYVRVQYGNLKKRTKVIHKTLNPQWSQTLEFPDTGERLILHVKDHNALLPTSSIGDCVVEYERLTPNQTVDKWIPLQGVKSGEIHIQVTRRVPDLQKKTSMAGNISSSIKTHNLSAQIRGILNKVQGLVEDGNLEGLSLALSEAESLEVAQEEYMLQLEREKALLIDKISELGHEISRTSSTPGKIPY